MTDFVPNPIEIAWAAGFFDGEGCATVRSNGGGKYLYLRLVISQNDTEVLERFMHAVGVGYILGPTHYKDKSLPMYQWQVNRNADVMSVIDLLMPLLSSKKKKQIADKLSVATKAKSYNMLTWEIVDEIRDRYSKGDISMRAFAEEYSASTGHISDIINYRSWVEK